jgi:hypothetical protein
VTPVACAALLLIVVAWSTRKPEAEVRATARQEPLIPVLLKQQSVREIVSPHAMAHDRYNDGPIKEALQALERSNRALAAELAQMAADRELEHEERLRAEDESKKKWTQFQEELAQSLKERLLLLERLREVERFAMNAEDEIRAVEERLRDIEDLFSPVETEP